MLSGSEFPDGRVDDADADYGTGADGQTLSSTQLGFGGQSKSFGQLGHEGGDGVSVITMRTSPSLRGSSRLPALPNLRAQNGR